MRALASLAIAIGIGSAAEAAAPVDCPLRDAPLTVESPLIDILLHPEGPALLSQTAPGFLEGLPPFMVKTQTPSFGAIMSLKGMAASGGVDPSLLEAAGPRLASLELTEGFKDARCARFDNAKVKLPKSQAPLRVLLFEKVNGFYHEEAIPAARNAIEKIADANGWSVVAADKGGAISRKNLSRIDVVVFSNNSGDVLTITQRQALRDFVERGGGIVALHGAGGDSQYWWDWYANELIGAQFIGHPMEPQFQETTVAIEPGSGAFGAGVAASWSLSDEWYSFATNPRTSGAQVVATIDESRYQTKGWGGADIAMGDDHPIAWTRCVGDGRSFYSAIGHRAEVYADANYQRLLQNALAWAGGAGACRTPSPGAKDKS